MNTHNSNGLYIFGPYYLNPTRRTIWRDDQIVPLTDKEFEVLAALVRRAGTPVDRDVLQKEVWPDTTHLSENNVAQHVRSLRKKLGKQANGQDYIRTLRSRGYYLGVSVEARADDQETQQQFKPPMDVSTSGAPEDVEFTRRKRRRGVPTLSITTTVVLSGVLAFALWQFWHPHARADQRSSGFFVGRLLSRATSEGKEPAFCDVRHLIYCLLVTPDGKKVYAFEKNGKNVAVLNASTLTITRMLTLPSNAISAVMTQDGKRIYVPSRVDGLFTINTSTDELRDDIRTGGPVQDVAVTPDGKRAFLAMGVQGVKEVDLTTHEFSVVSKHPSPQFVAIDPTGRQLFVSYQSGGPGGRPGHDALAIYDLKSKQAISSITGLPRVGGPILFTPFGDMALLDGWDACITAIYDHVGCPAVPSRISHLLWPAEHNRTEPLSLPAKSQFGTFSPDGTRYVFGGTTLTVFDIARRKVIEQLERSNEHYQAIAFAPRGDRLFVSYGHKPGLLAFETETPECSNTEVGLVNLYTGDGTLDDAAGAALRSVSSLEPVQFTPGLVGQAFRFTARPRGFLEISFRDACLNCPDEWTIRLYVKFAVVAREGTILRRLPATLRPGYRIFQSNDNTIGFRLDGDWSGSFTGVTRIMAGRWYELEIAYDGKAATLFIDGKPDGQMSMPELAHGNINWGDVYVGGSPDGEPLDGWVDELGFYGRALNAAETHTAYEAHQRNCAGH